MTGVRRRLYLAILCAALSGCQTTLFEWGSYEASLQRMYSPKYELVVGEEIQVLSKEIERTQRRKRRVPPGKIAHLGYLYALLEDYASARDCFQAEKGIYPESSVFMDGTLARMK